MFWLCFCCFCCFCCFYCFYCWCFFFVVVLTRVPKVDIENVHPLYYNVDETDDLGLFLAMISERGIDASAVVNCFKNTRYINTPQKLKSALKYGLDILEYKTDKVANVFIHAIADRNETMSSHILRCFPSIWKAAYAYRIETIVQIINTANKLNHAINCGFKLDAQEVNIESVLKMSRKNNNSVLFKHIISHHVYIWKEISQIRRDKILHYSMCDPEIFEMLHTNYFCEQNEKQMKKFLVEAVKSNSSKTGKKSDSDYNAAVQMVKIDKFFDCIKYGRPKNDTGDESFVGDEFEQFFFSSSENIAWLIKHSFEYILQQCINDANKNAKYNRAKIQVFFDLNFDIFTYCIDHEKLTNLMTVFSYCNVKLTKEMVEYLVIENQSDLCYRLIKLGRKNVSRHDKYGSNKIVENAALKHGRLEILERFCKKDNGDYGDFKVSADMYSPEKREKDILIYEGFEFEPVFEAGKTYDARLKINLKSNIRYYDECIRMFRDYYNTKEFNFNVYQIANSNIESSLTNIYLRCRGSRYLRDFLFDNIICNEKYFVNPDYKYKCSSSRFGRLESVTNGIFLFHCILSNADLSTAFVKVIPTLDKQLLLTFNRTNRIALECLAFGSYNEIYRNVKFSKDIRNSQFAIKYVLFKWLHYCQQVTIQLLFENLKR